MVILILSLVFSVLAFVVSITNVRDNTIFNMDGRSLKDELERIEGKINNLEGELDRESGLLNARIMQRVSNHDFMEETLRLDKMYSDYFNDIPQKICAILDYFELEIKLNEKPKTKFVVSKRSKK